MHHPDPSGDSGSVKKMAHTAVFHRRGSNTSSGSSSTLSTPVGTSSHSSAAEEYQTSLLIQCQTPAASSSPGPHHPSHSLNLHPQAIQSAGAQMKKKSGFQITSVTPAQITVSTNNSIAEDTESYDDLDESHTEDLSSSEIMDVSLSRANDIVGAERSSSEETLNNFHEADTPGLLSPNQPSHLHSLNQAPQHGGGMVNGTVHRHPHHQNHGHAFPLSSGPVSTSSTLASVTQKMPSNVGVSQTNVASQPVGIVGRGSSPGILSSATGTAVSIVNPQTSSVSNVNMLSSANVPARGGISTSANSSSAGFPLNAKSAAGGGRGAGGSSASSGNLMTNNGMNQQQQNNLNSDITLMTSTISVVTVASASGGPALLSGIQAPHCPPGAPVTISATTAQPTPTPAPATASSRFRVVKLDSSSEPFKKGRWICTDFYDKETPNSASCSSTSDAGASSTRQFVSENFVACSERESTSGSSVSSTLSTVSHYMDSICSGEAGGPSVSQHALDYASLPQGFQANIPSVLSMGVSHTQPHNNPQDITYSHIKAGIASSTSSNSNQPKSMPGHPITSGMTMPTLPQQQLTYAQAVANQPTESTQGLVGVQPHQLGYAPVSQHPSAPPVQMRSPDYSQPHQGIPQAASSQHLMNQGVPSSSGQANGACQMIGGIQQPQALFQSQLQQPSSLQATTSNTSFNVGVTGEPLQSHVDCQQQKQHNQSLPTQIQNLGLCTHLPTTMQSQLSAQSVPPSNPPIDHQAQPQVLNVGDNTLPPPGVPHSVSQNLSSAQAVAHAAQASALYACLPTFTTTQLQDAQRLLLQHQSALLGLPKLSGGDLGSGLSTGQSQEAEGHAAIASALTASAGLKTVDGEDDGSSGASVVAIDNKIEQAMDLVKSHLMYAVREEVEVLKEQIKELIERNSQLEQENTLLKTLASPEQMAQFQAQVQTTSLPAAPTAATPGLACTVAQAGSHTSGPPA